jgi:transposase
LRRPIPIWLEDTTDGLSVRLKKLLTGLWHDLRALDAPIAELDEEIATIAASDPVAQRLQQLRGVGPMIATALLATVGDASQFANGRQMAASFGLTPKQNSSGGKERLLGISKRGDSYVRCLLVHGARAMIADGEEQGQVRSAEPVGDAHREHQASERRGRGVGQQDCADCLGNDPSRNGLPASPCYELESSATRIS